MSLIKIAIEGGLRTDIPNAWKVKRGMGMRGNIPLADCLPKQASSHLLIPMSHLKEDHKELEDLKGLGKKVVAKANEMEADDSKAKKNCKV